MPTDKLSKLEAIAKLAYDGASKADFEAFTKQILAIALEIGKQNKLTTGAILSAHKDMLNQMADEKKNDILEIKTAISNQISSKIEELAAVLNKETDQKIKEAISEFITKDEVEDKLNELPEPSEPIPETPESIKEKLGKLKIEDIEGLKDALKGKEKKGFVAVGMAGRDLFVDIDISSQLDGVTKTFNIPTVWKILTVDLSSFPYGALRKTADFTYTPTTITFTSAIDAATQLAAGTSCILTCVRG